MRISIAMATYNGADFIRAQLDSFAGQSRLPNELVINDDGSTDATRAIVDDFARTAPFAVSFEVNPHRLGYARNFEAAVLRCSGEIIFLSDQDDVWFADKLGVIAAEFDVAPALQVVVNDQLITDRDLAHHGVTKLHNLKRLGMSADGLIEGCCTAFRAGFGHILFPFPATAQPLLDHRLLAHDSWINELAIALQVRGVVPRALQYFRRYGSNTTDWFVSSPITVGTRDLVAHRVARAPVEAWLTRVGVLNFYAAWLSDSREALARAGLDPRPALDRFERERSCLETRAALVRLSVLRRLAAIARFYMRGGYAYFHGWKSALRDVIRPA